MEERMLFDWGLYQTGLYDCYCSLGSKIHMIIQNPVDPDMIMTFSRDYYKPSHYALNGEYNGRYIFLVKKGYGEIND